MNILGAQYFQVIQCGNILEIFRNIVGARYFQVIQCGRHNDIFKFWLQWRSRVRKTIVMVINKINKIEKGFHHQNDRG